MIASIAVIHLARAVNGEQPLRRFIKSYLQHAAGVSHHLIVLFKGYSDRTLLAEHRALLEGVPFRAIELPDEGFDIESYVLAASEVKHDLLCFLNSYSQILADDWLSKLVRPFEQEQTGITGATSSWESVSTDWFCLRPKSWIRWLAGVSVRWIQFPLFPNPHVRSNAFAIRREVFLSLRLTRVRTKMRAWRIESGRSSITRRVLKRGYTALVVGRDGTAYSTVVWPHSGTFWSGGQANLLIADNQTERWELSNARDRLAMEATAWRHPMVYPSHMQQGPFFSFQQRIASWKRQRQKPDLQDR